MGNHCIVTLQITTPQPNCQDDKVETVTKIYPKTLATADGMQGMRLDNFSFCCLALAEFPMSSVKVLDVKER